MKNLAKNFKDIQNHLKSVGFVFQGSEIYGGLANTWDYGHLGVMLINNLKKAWWDEFILKEERNVSIDTKILMNPKVWEASGHLENFSDPLIENKINGKRYRADKLIEEKFPEINSEKMTNNEMEEFIKKNIKECDNSKVDWTPIRNFQLMFETSQGTVEGSKSKVFLRPETAQGIFVNFKNIQRSLRMKIPFGIGQVGKSFRNEVTPGNFIFRTREFEQMELEFFCHPEEDKKWFEFYSEKSFLFLQKIGIKKESLRIKDHSLDELAHYSKATKDIEFLFPFGWGELMGIANRGDFDLKTHSKYSGENLEYLDQTKNKKITPFVIEPSIGLDRLALAVIVDSYQELEFEGKKRLVLKLDKRISPYKFAILPLNKKFHSKTAKKIYKELVDKGISVNYDDAGSIGKRYRRQDAIGTPFAITIIDETENEQKVTIRFRDTTEQEKINLDDIVKFL